MSEGPFGIPGPASESGIIECRSPISTVRALRAVAKGASSDINLLAGRAADEIERLRAFAESFGQCACQPGMCDTASDFQCRAREALTGVSNQQELDTSK